MPRTTRRRRRWRSGGCAPRDLPGRGRGGRSRRHPFACEDIWTLATAGRITLHLREFEVADLQGAWLVHTATGDSQVDDLVAESAEARQLWCVRADDAARSSAWTPAVARVGDVVVAVNGGGDPKQSETLRNAIATALSTGQLPLRRHRANSIRSRRARRRWSRRSRTHHHPWTHAARRC